MFGEDALSLVFLALVGAVLAVGMTVVVVVASNPAHLNLPFLPSVDAAPDGRPVIPQFDDVVAGDSPRPFLPSRATTLDDNGQASVTAPASGSTQANPTSRATPKPCVNDAVSANWCEQRLQCNNRASVQAIAECSTFCETNGCAYLRDNP